MIVGRYAPSPSGELHVGNLRTAMLAWLFALRGGGELRLRIDDLDPRLLDSEFESVQRASLARVGVEFSGDVLWQSTRLDAYQAAVDTLTNAGLTYSCFCSRREVREAVQAPHDHLPEGAYPGTCRELSSADRARRAEDRPAALRVKADAASVQFQDLVHGDTTVTVDDFVVQRNDGVASYNLATILDDGVQGVTQVVRGADLLEGTGRQVWLRSVLGLAQVTHAHVPLMVNDNGDRLAKRDGSITLTDLAEAGYDDPTIVGMLAHSVGLTPTADPTTLPELLKTFDPSLLPREPTKWQL